MEFSVGTGDGPSGNQCEGSNPTPNLRSRRFMIERQWLAAFVSMSALKRGFYPVGKQPGLAAPGIREVHTMALLHIPFRHLTRPLLAGVLACALGLAAAARADFPPGYPVGYQKIVDAAKQEGKVVIYSTTDAALVRPFVKAFEAAYPGVTVEYD